MENGNGNENSLEDYLRFTIRYNRISTTNIYFQEIWKYLKEKVNLFDWHECYLNTQRQQWSIYYLLSSWNIRWTFNIWCWLYIVYYIHSLAADGWRHSSVKKFQSVNGHHTNNRLFCMEHHFKLKNPEWACVWTTRPSCALCKRWIHKLLLSWNSIQYPSTIKYKSKNCT